MIRRLICCGLVLAALAGIAPAEQLPGVWVITMQGHPPSKRLGRAAQFWWEAKFYSKTRKISAYGIKKFGSREEAIKDFEGFVGSTPWVEGNEEN